MKTIYKYNIPHNGKITLPVDHTILKFGYQYEQLCMWALVDSECEKVLRQFKVVGTGWNLDEMGDGWTYMETLFENGFVWHVFMKEE